MTLRRRREDTAGIEAEVRLVLFQAIDAGDVPRSAIEALTPDQRVALETKARALLPSLRGQDRETVGRVLERLGAVDAARLQIKSKRAGARSEAGEFLGESGSVDALSDLLELLRDFDPKVRWAAARGLGRLGNPSAVEPLLAAVDGPCAVPVDVIADAVLALRSCPIAKLRPGLGSPSVSARALTVELLGRFQVLAAIDEVADLLHHDPSVEVRARAARSLGRMESPRAVPPLVACAGDGPVAVRAQAIWALGQIGADEGLDVLRSSVLGDVHHLSAMAADALAMMGPKGRRVLGEVAAGDGRTARMAARAMASKRPLHSVA